MEIGLNKKRIILNVIFIILEIIGVIITCKEVGRFSFEYYTEDSNVLALVVSAIYVAFLMKSKKLPKWLNILRISTVVSLILTFIIVLLVLLPMSRWNISFMYGKANFFFHLVCPLFLLYIFFKDDDKFKLSSKEITYACIPTLLYSVILVILNVLKLIKGPYPFLYVYEQPVIVSCIWFLTINLITYLFCFFFNKRKNR